MVEMRPKWAYRLGLPVGAVGFLVVASGERAWERWGVTVVFSLWAVAAWRDHARAEDGTLYERGLWRWYPPLPLESVTRVDLHSHYWGGQLFPHRDLWLWSSSGVLRTFEVRWWHDWRPLVRAVVLHLSHPGGDGAGRTWKVTADSKTRERLEAIAAPTHRTGRFSD